MKNILIGFFMMLFLNIMAQPSQKPCCGKIVHLENFPSKFVTHRNIDIWLPENYKNDSKFSLLYMHDRQMLFDTPNT
jgi:hypothetical protein